MQDAIPAPIRQFLREHIRSVVQLELLLLLHREPERSWTVTEIAERLYIPGSFAESLLDGLRTQCLASTAEANRFRFDPKLPEHSRVIDELARLYKERPHSTIHVIYTSKNDTLQSFADAFRFRRKEGE